MRSIRNRMKRNGVRFTENQEDIYEVFRSLIANGPRRSGRSFAVAAR